MVEQASTKLLLCIMRDLPNTAFSNLATTSVHPDWAVSSVVEHCLHTAGVTSSKLVPPTKNIFKFFKYIAAKAALGLFAKVVGDCCLATLGLISSASTVDPVWSEVSD